VKSQEPRSANWRNQAFLAAWTLYAGYYICRRDVGTSGKLGSSHIALELACFGATYAVGQFVGGSLADSVSARRTALGGALISVICTILQGWASPHLELTLQLANGLGQGLGWPSLLKLIGGWFGSDERDKVLGWWSSSYILGGFLASVLTQWLSINAAELNIDPFHLLHLVPPGILLVTAIVFAFSVRKTEQSPASTQIETSAPKLSEWGHWKSILRNRSMRYASGMYFFLKMTRYTLLFWLPHYLISAVGYSTYTATRTASYFEIFGMIGPIAIGYLTTRAFGRNRMRLCAGIMYGLAFVCLLHPLLAASGFFGMVVSISLLGILIHGSDMLVSGMAVLDTVPAEQHGRAVGFVNGIGSIGQAISPLLATLFVAHFGWTKLFDLFVLFTLISGAICTVGARFTPLNAQALTVQGLSFPRLRYNLQRK
jgi:sugar phosphate permease